MTPVGVFFCWRGGAERDFVNNSRMCRFPVFTTAQARGYSGDYLNGTMYVCKISGQFQILKSWTSTAFP